MAVAVTVGHRLMVTTMSAVFLSASVPYGSRAEQFPKADPYLIQVTVRALVVTCLGRRRIVWGGHPAITPMVWAAADDLEVQYPSVVHL